jgi:hypothetical protein
MEEGRIANLFYNQCMIAEALIKNIKVYLVGKCLQIQSAWTYNRLYGPFETSRQVADKATFRPGGLRSIVRE